MHNPLNYDPEVTSRETPTCFPLLSPEKPRETAIPKEVRIPRKKPNPTVKSKRIIPYVYISSHRSPNRASNLFLILTNSRPKLVETAKIKSSKPPWRREKGTRTQKQFRIRMKKQSSSAKVFPLPSHLSSLLVLLKQTLPPSDAQPI